MGSTRFQRDNFCCTGRHDLNNWLFRGQGPLMLTFVWLLGLLVLLNDPGWSTPRCTSFLSLHFCDILAPFFLPLSFSILFTAIILLPSTLSSNCQPIFSTERINQRILSITRFCNYYVGKGLKEFRGYIGVHVTSFFDTRYEHVALFGN